MRNQQDSALVPVAVISSNYFSTLGVAPHLGRLPGEDNADSPSRDPVVVLSFEGWHKHFGGDPGIIGKPVTLNAGRGTVVAVLPQGFRGTNPYGSPELWIPLGTWEQINPGEQRNRSNREFWDWDSFARLAPGATIEQAQQQLEAVSRQMAAATPQQERERQLRVFRNDACTDPHLRTVGTTLGVLATIVFVIAAVNALTLILVFGQRRRMEFASRLAVGATPARLLRQLITENNVVILFLACLRF